MNNKQQQLTLTVLRGIRVVSITVLPAATLKSAKEHASVLLNLHVGAAVSIENKSGLVVGVVR